MLAQIPNNVPNGYVRVTTGDVKPRLDRVLSEDGTWGKIQPIDIEVLGREVQFYYAVARPVRK